MNDLTVVWSRKRMVRCLPSSRAMSNEGPSPRLISRSLPALPFRQVSLERPLQTGLSPRRLLDPSEANSALRQRATAPGRSRDLTLPRCSYSLYEISRPYSIEQNGFLTEPDIGHRSAHECQMCYRCEGRSMSTRQGATA